MSWNASGQIEGTGGGDGDFDESRLQFSPARADMAEGPNTQADFLLETIGRAFEAGVIDGLYSVSLHGHDGGDEGRKGLGFSLVPVA